MFTGYAKRILMISCVLMISATTVFAVPIDWVDWVRADKGYPGAATGLLDGVTVNYRGEVEWAQVNNIGTYYWTEPFSQKPYTGNSVVDNAPGTSDIIVMTGEGKILNTVDFSAPVIDPIMAICSMGQPNWIVEYYFARDLKFNVLSYGPGYWGGPGTLATRPGNVLLGEEGHGVIQFYGAIRSISWYALGDEYWHGFTIGIPGKTAVPEPSSMLLLGAGLLGVGALRKKVSR